MASTAASGGRRRGVGKTVTSEDQTLNMIAREAEARLAAKRAARAEARSIRMNELERMQKEADEKMDKEYEEDNALIKKVGVRGNTTPKSSTLTNDTSSLEHQQMKETLRETTEKYRRAMVHIAQLDNERQALQYQVECLKDNIEDLEESLENAIDELTHKNKEFNKLNKEHLDLEGQFNKCSLLLADRERILDEHGINLDGTLREEEKGESVDGVKTNHVNNYSQEECEEMLSEIEQLRQTVRELKRDKQKGSSEEETSSSRKDNDVVRRGVELERSAFVDVSAEATAIQEERQHAGFFLNNNEKCDDFEVIDDGSQQGGMRHFEDRSFEASTRSSLLSSQQDQLSVERGGQTDYEIIEKNLPATRTLDIDNLISHEDDRSVTPSVAQSDINVNKYVVSDEDTEEDTTAQQQAFNVSQYYASSVEDNLESNDMQPVEESYDAINTRVVDEEDRGSPYVDLANDGGEMYEESSEPSTDQKFFELNDPEEGVSAYVEVDDGEIYEQSATEAEDVPNNKPTTVVAPPTNSIEPADSLDTGFLLSSNDGGTASTEHHEETTTQPIIPERDYDMHGVETYSGGEAAVSQDVLDLYEKTAATTVTPPKEATFGIFATGSPQVGDDNESHPETDKKGWLIRVESFSQPQPQSPEIKVVDEGEQEIDTPVAKERKKKKKRRNKQRSLEDEDTPVSTAPELLGYASDNNAPAHDPDIPQQFLDVSRLTGSTSDLSDDGEEGGKRGKRNNKKEACKTQ